MNDAAWRVCGLYVPISVFLGMATVLVSVGVGVSFPHAAAVVYGIVAVGYAAIRLVKLL